MCKIGGMKMQKEFDEKCCHQSKIAAAESCLIDLNLIYGLRVQNAVHAATLCWKVGNISGSKLFAL